MACTSRAPAPHDALRSRLGCRAMVSAAASASCSTPRSRGRAYVHSEPRASQVRFPPREPGSGMDDRLKYPWAGAGLGRRLSEAVTACRFSDRLDAAAARAAREGDGHGRRSRLPCRQAVTLTDCSPMRVDRPCLESRVSGRPAARFQSGGPRPSIPCLLVGPQVEKGLRSAAGAIASH